jgi:glycosyltransferase involved in cell wall biosynthesis
MPADGATQVAQFNTCLYERLLELASSLGKCDVIVAHDWLTILAADRARKRMGGRLVFTVHDSVIGKTFGNLTNQDKFIALLERWGCHVADRVVAVSRHVRQELEKMYGAPKDKLHVVPCGVDPRWFENVDERIIPDLRSALVDEGNAVITYVGRLDPEKGVEKLIDAFARLESKRPRVSLVLAGKGSEQEKLELLARDRGVGQKVRFLGYVAGPALEALYKVSNLLVCPSLYEPFGIVPLEGMINRVPVIVSDTGGMSEIVEHGRSGLKVRPGDPAALAEAIDRLISNPDEARRLAIAGQERAKAVYNWDRVASQLEPVYGVTSVKPSNPPPRSSGVLVKRPRLTAGLRVKDGERYAEECLKDLSEYVDEIVILDDGSTDRTIEICRSFPKVTNVVRWEKDFFHEGIDRNVVLALVKNTNPDWILLPDIDEVFEAKFKDEIQSMMDDSEVSLHAFLFCHFWRSRTHYRVDGKWGRETREFPIPRLVRNQPSLHYPVHRPLGTAQISGVKGKKVVSSIRVKHYGHLYEDVSRQKVKVYSALDPGSDYSFMVDESGLELEEWKEYELARVGADS